MRNRTARLLLLLLLLLALPLAVCAETPTVGTETLTVGVAGSLPFVDVQDRFVDGISVRIWKAVAGIEKIDYEFVPFPQVETALSALKKGDIDVVVGPISITSDRAAEVAFTQPYFRSGLGILSRLKERGLAERVRPFLSRAFFYGVSFLLVLLTLVGALVWLCERRTNSEQFPQGITGLGSGMWFAIVTMTTVGYGDKCPVTGPGRLLTGAWMLIATISFSTLTAGIATALTLSSLNSAEISNPEALRGRRVAVVTGTTSAKAVRHFGATELQCASLPKAIELLTQESVDAVVFDHPALNHYLQANPQDQLRLAHSTFEAQNYGFALPLESPLLHHFNVALLKLAEEGQLQDIEDEWLAQADSE